MTPEELEHSQDSETSEAVSDRRRPRVIFLGVAGVLLSLATLAIYFQTYWHLYVTYDDPEYIYLNRHVRGGLTLSGLKWAITALYINWHPLTWLSLMLDIQLFGPQPGPQHLVSAGIHIAATILLLIALSQATGKPGRSALVAGIFALHPLHVESVAWTAERKDVLCAFFEMLTLLFYVRYSQNQTRSRYLAVALAFACALMSKPMAVTFPLVMLLLDYWPLGRLRLPIVGAEAVQLVREKIPLVAMSVVTSVLTTIAQRNAGAVMSLGRIPFPERAGNAATASLWYIRKAFWPSGLAFFYPIQSPPIRGVLLSLMALAAITGAAFRWRIRRPYLLVGWLWYLVMLLPVIGIVQVGMQAVADRYSYLPLIGLSIVFIWLVADALSGRYILQAFAGLMATGGLVVLAVAAWWQTSWWKDSETLYRHAIAVTQKNYVAENNLGVVLALKGERAEAIEHYRNAIGVRWNVDSAYANLGGALFDAGRFDEAFVELQKALSLNPELQPVQSALGNIYKRRRDYTKARELLAKAVANKPNDAFAHSDLCFVMGKTGSADEGIAHCQEAIRMSPMLGEAYDNLAKILAEKGDKAGAIEVYEQLLEILPEYPGALATLDRLRTP